jgi:hypothetical protein
VRGAQIDPDRVAGHRTASAPSRRLRRARLQRGPARADPAPG